MQQILLLIRVFIILLLLFQSTIQGIAQAPDMDSLRIAKSDSINSVKDAILKQNFELTATILNRHPYFNFREKAGYALYIKKINPPGRELNFYIVATLFLFFAILKAGFSKYFSDLINLFLRRSLKQRQIKQQVVQNALPSFLFNIFFVLIGGFYAALAIQRTTPNLPFSFLELLLYTISGIAIIYIGKYFVLKFIGWVFNIIELSNNYIFLIFLVNKIIALILLPIIVVLALVNKEITTIAWTLSLLLVSCLLFYRYISAMQLVRKDKGVSFFHFVLYVSAFEILPTIILYKVILLF